MATIHSSIEIEAAPEEIFPWLLDPDRVRRRIEGLEQIRFHDGGPDEVGSRFVQRLEESGRLVAYEGRVVACEAPHHYALELATEGFAMAVDYRLEQGPSGRRTRVDYRCQISSTPWWSRILGTLLGWDTRRVMRQQLLRLKELVEAERAGS